MRGVVLYGPPAAGKDTVTRALTSADPRFIPVPLLKAGPGRHDGYTMTTAQDIDGRDALIWDFERYGARYALDRADLAAAPGWPVLHCGNPNRIADLIRADLGPWLIVGLWCSRDIAVSRLRKRDPLTVADRLAVWDSTPPALVSLVLNTGTLTPQESAAQVMQHFAPSAPFERTLY